MNKSLKQKNRKLRFFHKWTNKGYGIFNSLKVMVKICVIPATYSLVVSPTVAIAQTDTVSVSRHLDLKEVVVSTKLKAESYSELNRVVQVVTQEEIQRISTSLLQDVLEKGVNVDVRQRGGNGVQGDLIFRGGSFDQVLVLLNGVNITDPQTGHHNLNIPIDLNSIQRIEVLQGPGARVYGAGAFSGAINIITQPNSKNQLKLSVKTGEHELFEGNLQGSVNFKNSSTFLSVSNNRSNGYIKNTDYGITNLFIHSLLATKSGNFNFFTGFQTKGFGANSFYTPKYPDQYERTSSLISSLGFERKWNQNTILINTYIRRHWDRFELFRDTVPSWYKSHNYHLTTVLGSKVLYRKMSRFGRTQLGVEPRSEGILSNVLGDALSSPKKAFGNDTAYYTKGKTRYIYNLFVDHTFYLKRFNISTGVNYSYCTAFHSEWSYGFDVSYSIVDQLRLYASANRSFRNPTFTDLYYVGPTNLGNSNLKPESAITYEGGLKSDFSLLSGYIGYFHREGKDIIDWIKKTPLDTKWQTENYTCLNTDGIEVATVSILKEIIPLVNTLSLSYSYLWQNKQSGNFDSYYVMDYLKQNFRLGLNHKLVSKLSATWNLSWQEREGAYINFSSGSSTSYKPFWLIDLKLNWIDNRYSIYTEVSNLFNTRYIDIANVMQPRRWIAIGFSYKFIR